MKNKMSAGLLGIFLGAFGIHHFYLGNTNKGLLYLLLSVFTGVGAMVFGIIGLVEGIMYLCMSDEEFENALQQNGAEASDKTQIKASINNDNLTKSLEKYNILKKYKTLLDGGVLTQQEFDSVKSNILR